MSVAPDWMRTGGAGVVVPTREASGPKGAPFSRDQPAAAEFQLSEAPVRITMAEILRLAEGDRLIIHADAEMGLGPGGAHRLAKEAYEALRLDELPFEVPVLVSAPGLRLEVWRPS